MRYKNGRHHEIHGQICGQIPTKKRGTVLLRQDMEKAYGREEGWGLEGPLWGHSDVQIALGWYVHPAMLRRKYRDML